MYAPTNKSTSPRSVWQFFRRQPEWILSPLLLVGLLGIWHFATEVLNIPTYIIPPPQDVWDSLVAGLLKWPLDPGGFWYHIGITLWEAILGFLLGSVVGVLIGFAVTHWKLLGRVTYPYLVGFQSLPKVALAPLLIIWFGFGIEGKVMITSVITFFPMLINSISGYRSVDPDRIDLARSCNASQFQIYWKIVLPGSLPFLFAGLSVSSVLALLGAIVGEFVGARAGLGILLLQYQQSMQIAPVFAILIILAFLGFLMNGVIHLLERHYCFWAQRSLETPEA
jgi:NitT/TauT family transport system permease protein